MITVEAMAANVTSMIRGILSIIWRLDCNWAENVIKSMYFDTGR
jgi:hypothetical protein